MQSETTDTQTPEQHLKSKSIPYEKHEVLILPSVYVNLRPEITKRKTYPELGLPICLQTEEVPLSFTSRCRHYCGMKFLGDTYLMPKNIVPYPSSVKLGCKMLVKKILVSSYSYLIHVRGL